MTTTPSPNAARLEHTYDAPAQLIWQMWTTAAGMEDGWSPDGFETRSASWSCGPAVSCGTP
jgi:uncharacterized protein YndB with AHSA1/START domain